MRTAVVTGAAQGLGLITAGHLGRLGYRIWLTDLKPLDEQCAQLRAEGIDAEGVSGDVSSEGFVAELAALLHGRHGAIDVLVNNAGISLIAPAEATSATQWRKVMDVNLLGPFL